jgi:hypothetical protein
LLRASSIAAAWSIIGLRAIAAPIAVPAMAPNPMPAMRVARISLSDISCEPLETRLNDFCRFLSRPTKLTVRVRVGDAITSPPF